MLSQFFAWGGWFLVALLNGLALFLLCRAFVPLRESRGRKLLLLLTLTGSSGMVIWVGDNNLLFTLPVFLFFFWFCTQGDPVGRLAVSLIFFCLMMSVCALLDTYLMELAQYDLMTRLLRPLIFWGLYLLFRARLPQDPVRLPRRLWELVLGLSCLPLGALVAVVLLTRQKHDFPSVYALAMQQGLVVLPFVLLTTLVLLAALLVLADHERLARTARLASLREVYYEGLQREQTQVRTLRHDLRNHLTVLTGLLEQGDTAQAAAYLDRLTGSPALGGSVRFCDNETANVVLSAKAEAMARADLTADFQIFLPKSLPLDDLDLCALLGNALDNAIESTREAPEKTIRVRCRADKGLFMLQVENPLSGKENADLSTTKSDRKAHGFGLPGMREIALRHGGSLEAGPRNGWFELVICFPL